MIMPTANGGIAQPTADSHDAEKNIFSDEKILAYYYLFLGDQNIYRFSIKYCRFGGKTL